jgi:hypothetical protein
MKCQELKLAHLMIFELPDQDASANHRSKPQMDNAKHPV